MVKHIYDNFYLEIHAVMDNPFRISGCNRYPFRGKRRHRCLPVIFHECLCETKRCGFLFFAGEVFRKTMSTSLRKSQTEASLTTSVLTCCSRTVSIHLLRQISRVFLPTLFVPIVLVRYVLYLVCKPLLADVGNYVARHTFKDKLHPV